MRAILRSLSLLVALLVAGALAAAPAGAITFGQPDGSLHPNVGGLLTDWDEESPGLDLLCSGTLIAPRVFLTAAHCVVDTETPFYVTFQPAWDEGAAGTAGAFSGTAFHDPRFATHGSSNFFDLAVMVIDEAPGIEPAQLPEVGLLARLKAAHQLRDQTFTAVGYGTVRDDKTGGPASLRDNEKRNYVLQSALSLGKARLQLSMNPSTGSGGTCYGDSGGPHFLGGKASDLIVSLTVTGDTWCRATDTTYRIDTPWAREFLEGFPGVSYPG